MTANHVDLNPMVERNGITFMTPFVVFTAEGDDDPVAVFPTDRVTSVRRVRREVRDRVPA